MVTDNWKRELKAGAGGGDRLGEDNGSGEETYVILSIIIKNTKCKILMHIDLLHKIS